jgi:hypothetical protein
MSVKLLLLLLLVLLSILMVLKQGSAVLAGSALRFLLCSSTAVWLALLSF